MSYKKFKFISPGIFINEIDNSQLPALPAAIGPAVIGRMERGPALKPIQVDSFSEFVEVFGNPIPGGQGGDVFRYGNYTSPTYAAYAAQAWLRNNSPMTVVRLLGQTNSSAVASGYAGWATADSVGSNTAGASNNGAYGLFICEDRAPSNAITGAIGGTGAPKNFDFSGSWGNASLMTGTLAAVWYLTKGSIQLSGNLALTASAVTQQSSSAFTFYQAVSGGTTFKATVRNESDAIVSTTAFNFDPDSPRFIRKVFNTNPIRTNSTVVGSDNDTNFWLGESFEGNLRTFPHRGGAEGISGSVPGSTYGIIMRLATPNEATDGANFKMSPTKSPKKQFAKTGWFIAQDLDTAGAGAVAPNSSNRGYTTGSFNPEKMQKLFRFNSRELGEETQRKIKIGIKDLRAADPLDTNQYGTFTVVVRDIRDTDAAPVIIEQYNECNLDPASNNYIARKIGNKFVQWDDIDKRYRTYGDFDNISNYIYVEEHDDTQRAVINEKCLPYGVYGPPRYVGWGVGASGSIRGYKSTNASEKLIADTGAFVGVGVADPFVSTPSTSGTLPATDDLLGAKKIYACYSGSTALAGFKFPRLRLRVSSSEGASLADPKDAYFGVDTTYNSSRFDESVTDVLRTKCEDLEGYDATSGKTEDMWIFTLDDVRNSAVSGAWMHAAYSSHAVYQSGSRVQGFSYTAHTASLSASVAGPGSVNYLSVIDDNYGGETAGWMQFTTCLAGGADGLDITESDPFRNSQWTSAAKATSDAPFNSISVAMDTLADPEVVEYNIASMPGLTNTALNNKLVDMCENRGDSLAIIDLEGGYKPPSESDKTRIERRGNVATVVKNKRNSLKINSSYGCAYYPWVQIRDTIAGVTLWAPPSVVAMGAMSYGEANSQLWFAPAGFTRGGLSANRAGGVPVVGVEEKLTSKQRDRLYENQINPIASFPAEGIVVFGQKTLQVGASALDRINVRRLLIYLKKQVSRFAATILFDQNVEVTWTRFKSKVEPFLADVKAGLGLTDYKVLLDETTTTPDLVDRNIMYAKIYIKPARSIEYIAIDFVITNSGASFED